jgi:hypothetical protein
METRLIDDLAGHARLADEEFCTDLYRALANNVWRKGDATVSPSWTRAEELVNELRVRAGQSALALRQSGGEGTVSALAAGELDALGWTHEPLETSRHDDEHAWQAADAPPPPSQGERFAPAGDSSRWREEAHAAADESSRPVQPREGTDL